MARMTVLVEGPTDELALRLAARRLGRDLDAEGVVILAINGAHAIGRSLLRLAADGLDGGLAGLYDEGEEEVIRAALERNGFGPIVGRAALERLGFFACKADLEEELIRAAGESIIATLIERERDVPPWHAFRKQPAWQGRPLDAQFHRFIRSMSERNSRYIRAIVEAIDPSALPRPIKLLLEYVDPARVPR
jgi:hypothetical protein